jgi:hypothetical protein
MIIVCRPAHGHNNLLLWFSRHLLTVVLVEVGAPDLRNLEISLLTRESFERMHLFQCFSS